MIALDTNVVIRLITRDNDEQLSLARQLVDNNPVVIPLLTLLECEWVLRARYRFSPTRIVEALAKLIAFPNISVENETLTLWAMDRHLEGADLSDMLLLVASHGYERFATFDKAIDRYTGHLSPIPVMVLS
jgi:predicted nucleic-acid-binding protein